MSDVVVPFNGSAGASEVNVEPATPPHLYRLQPLYDRVLVHRHPEPETFDKDGLIVKPDSARGQEKPLMGTVLEVGEGRPLEGGGVQKPRVRPGDIVLFGQFAGVELPKELGADLMMVREEELLAIIAEAEPDAPAREAAAS